MKEGRTLYMEEDMGVEARGWWLGKKEARG